MGFRYGEAEALKQYFIFSMNAIFQSSLEEMLASIGNKKVSPNKAEHQKKADQETESDDEIVW
jgi:hypothetical protein